MFIAKDLSADVESRLKLAGSLGIVGPAPCRLGFLQDLVAPLNLGLLVLIQRAAVRV